MVLQALKLLPALEGYLHVQDVLLRCERAQSHRAWSQCDDPLTSRGGRSPERVGRCVWHPFSPTSGRRNEAAPLLYFFVPH